MSKPRANSATGVYHVIMRGINHESIAYDEEDFKRLISTVIRFSRKYGVKIITYAVMSNHIHLEAGSSELSEVSDMVRSICTSYVRHYFNEKYSREGSLFQSRFKSRAVSDDNDLISLSRYIILNPSKGGMDYKSYAYSSYQATINAYQDGNDKGFLDTELIRGRIKLLSEYIGFMQSKVYELRQEAYKVSDEEIRKYIYEETGVKAQEVRNIQATRLRKLLSELMRNEISIRRIRRLTGLKTEEILSAASL